jgi:hypothetical protein
MTPKPIDPYLTTLDRRVLDCLPMAEDIDIPGARAEHVADRAIRPSTGNIRSPTTDAERREVLEILRGLEAVGLAWNDNGWWRKG